MANHEAWRDLIREATPSTGAPESRQTATLGIHLSQGRIFVAVKADNEASLSIPEKKGFPSAILVRRRSHAAGSEQDGDRVDGGRADASRLNATFVFGDQLAIAPGITDTLCYPYSFASASPSQDCPPYRQQELLEELLKWVASEAIQGADQASTIANVAVVTPRELPPEMEESIATALAKGFGFDLERIRVHFMNESVANLAYLVHGERKKPKAGDRIVALHYGSSHSQVVAGALSENGTPRMLYNGDVEAGSRTFEDCIEKELDNRTLVTAEAKAVKEKARAVDEEGTKLAIERQQLEKDRQRIKVEVDDLKSKLEQERQKCKDVEEQLKDAARAAKAEVDDLKSKLELERQQRQTVEEQLKDAATSAKAEVDDLKSKLELARLQRQVEEQLLEYDQQRTTREVDDLKSKLELERQQRQNVEEQLKDAATSAKAEVDDLKSKLELERQQRQVEEKQLKDAARRLLAAVTEERAASEARLQDKRISAEETLIEALAAAKLAAEVAQAEAVQAAISAGDARVLDERAVAEKKLAEALSATKFAAERAQTDLGEENLRLTSRLQHIQDRIDWSVRLKGLKEHVRNVLWQLAYDETAVVNVFGQHEEIKFEASCTEGIAEFEKLINKSKAQFEASKVERASELPVGSSV